MPFKLSKQKEGLAKKALTGGAKSIKQIKSDRKTHKIILQHKDQYDNYTLPEHLYKCLNIDEKRSYLQNALNSKYKKNIRYRCVNCAETRLFDKRGELTDDELEDSINN